MADREVRYAQPIREPYLVLHKETAGFKDVYGSAAGTVVVECMRIYPEGTTSNTAIVFSHPIGGGAFLPLVSALARAGHHVIYAIRAIAVMTPR